MFLTLESIVVSLYPTVQKKAFLTLESTFVPLHMTPQEKSVFHPRIYTHLTSNDSTTFKRLLLSPHQTESSRNLNWNIIHENPNYSLQTLLSRKGSGSQKSLMQRCVLCVGLWIWYSNGFENMNDGYICCLGDNGIMGTSLANNKLLLISSDIYAFCRLFLRHLHWPPHCHGARG